MFKWILSWILCLIGGAGILIGGLVATILLGKIIFWLLDNWPGTVFLVIFSGFVMAMAAVLHNRALK